VDRAPPAPATWYLVAPIPPRLTFLEGNRGTRLSSEAMALGNGVAVRAGVRQRADQHVAADSRKASR